MFANRNHISSIDVINYLKSKIRKSKLTFMIKADLKDFFLNIKKKYIIKGLSELVSLHDNKFYHLIKNYLQSGYAIKILMKSKKIGARKVKIIYKNKSKDHIYQGTVLAPLFSNIINTLLIKKINKKINTEFTSGIKKKGPNNIIYRLSEKKYSATLQNIKPSFFINEYKRAWLLNYSDNMILLGYLSKEDKDKL